VPELIKKTQKRPSRLACTSRGEFAIRKKFQREALCFALSPISGVIQKWSRRRPFPREGEKDVQKVVTVEDMQNFTIATKIAYNMDGN
jgi:hypothetical protein